MSLKEHSAEDKPSLVMGTIYSALVVFRKFLPIGESVNGFEYFILLYTY